MSCVSEYLLHIGAYSVFRFNMGEGQEENAIVTSTGRYVVAWDFGKVKKNKLDGYVIKKCVLIYPYH